MFFYYHRCNVFGQFSLEIFQNVQDSYPSEPPLWFIISDDAAIIDLLEKPLETFNDAQERENRIVNQVNFLITRIIQNFKCLFFLKGGNNGPPIM